MRFVIMLLVAVSGLAPVSANAQVVVSELGWAGSDLSTADEWFELAPTGSGSLSLSGWTVYALSSSSASLMLTFHEVEMETLPLVIANYPESQSRLLEPPALVTTAVALPNVNLHLELRRADGSVADEVVLGQSPAGHTGAGEGIWASAERIDPLRSGADPANWKTGVGTSGFDEGATVRGSPGTVDWQSSSSAASSSSSVVSSPPSEESSSVASSVPMEMASSSSEEVLWPGDEPEEVEPVSPDDVRISGLIGRLRITEVMADPPGSDDGEWIEVANISGETLNVDGVILQRRGLSRSYRFVDVLGTGAVLLPGQYVLVPRERSLLTLPNDGGEVLLTFRETVIDTFSYPQTVQGVSVGLLGESLTSFCVASPGYANRQILPPAALQVQSGSPIAVGRVNLNVAADVPDLPGTTTCRVDFDDGTIVESCNPPSHAFSTPGEYAVRLTVESACGIVQSAPLNVHVLPSSSSSASSSSSLRSSSTPSSSGAQQRSCTPSAATGVVLSGALPNPAESDEEHEVITLENLTTRAITLCGWTLDDGPDGSRPFSLDGRTVEPLGTLSLLRTETKIALNNDGDDVRLFAPGQEEPVAVLSYDHADEDEWIIYGALHEEEKSSITLSDADLDQNFATVSSNYSHVALHEEKIPLSMGDIVLSEIFSHPDKGGMEWVEVQNRSEKTIDLSGWLLDDDPAGGSRPWVIPHGTALAPGAFRLFYGSDTKLALNDGGDVVELRRGSQVIDHASLPKLPTGVSLALVAEEWCAAKYPSPGESNPGCSDAHTSMPGGSAALVADSQNNSLLAMLQSRAEPPSSVRTQTTPAWLFWLFCAGAALGILAWSAMHLQEWAWKLRKNVNSDILKGWLSVLPSKSSKR